MQTLTNPSHISTFSLFIVFLFCLFYFGWMLGNRPFAVPDEARYVEIPREMLATGDFITPRLNGVKYFEKPPLFYWLQAAAMKLFGSSEGAMRLVTMIIATLGVVGTTAFAWRHFGPVVAVCAAFILATSPLYFALSHMIIIDMTISILVALEMFVFYQALLAPVGWQRRGWFWAFAVLCGLGVMTKGVMALALAGPVIVFWLTLTRQWRKLRPFYPFSAIFLFLAITAPWHFWVSYQNPEFAYKYFVVEHFLRFTTTIHRRSQPFWFFIPILLGGLFPWITLLHKRKDENYYDPLKLYLLLWVVWVLLFFSFSNSKLVPYILPVFPPLAILLAYLLERAEPRQFLPFVISAFLLGIVGLALPYESFSIRPTLVPFLNVLSVGCLLAGIVGFMGIWYQRKVWIFSAMGALAITINQLTVLAVPVAQKPSVKSLITNAPIKPEDRLVSYHMYLQDLPVYARRIVTVVESKDELEFGMSVEKFVLEWMINEARFLELWQSTQRLWVVMRPDQLAIFQRDHPNFLIYTYRETPAFILLTNKEISHAS